MGCGLLIVNEYFEAVFNVVMATQIVFQKILGKNAFVFPVHQMRSIFFLRGDHAEKTERP